jgi:peptidyl-prolyl cis-trans isomerase SurA
MNRVATLLVPAALVATLLAGCRGDVDPTSEGNVKLPVLSDVKGPRLSDSTTSTPYTGETAEAMGHGADVVVKATPTAASSAAANAARRQDTQAPPPPKVAMPRKPLPILATGSKPPTPSDNRRPLTSREAGEQLKVVNSIVARVNDDIITREDIYRGMRGLVATWKATLPPREFQTRVRIEAAQRLRSEINLRLLMHEAKKKYNEQQEEILKAEVEKQWQRLLARFDGSVDAIQAELEKEGHTQASWRKQQHDMVMVYSFLSEYLAPRISITQRDMRQHYERVKKKYVVMPMERMQLIKLRLADHANREAMLSLGRSLSRRAQMGEDFGKLAREFSRGPKASAGGDWGMMHRDCHRVDAINKALATLAVGGVSEAIVDRDSVYIVRVAERQIARTIPFTEVQEECRAAVKAAKREQLSAEYVKSLYEKSFVEVYEENL